MRIFIGAIVAISLMGGCAVSIRNQHGSGSEPVPRGLIASSGTGSSSEPVPRGLIDPPAVSRPLKNLAQGAKGKVLLHHVDGKGQNTTWSTKLKMRASFRLSVDCVEASGEMIVLIGRSRLPRQCSIGATNIEFSMIPNKLTVESIKVEVPKGAKWAILISTPSQS